MDFVKQFLEKQGGALVSQLTSQLGFDAGQAQRFVPAAVERVAALLRGGKLDPKTLLGGGDPSAKIVSQVDTRALANEAGVDETTATAGLQTLLPGLLEALRGQLAGGAGLSSLLGGASSGAAGGLLGKLGGFLKK